MKYFVVSDIHGYLKELKRDLEMAGFDRDNPNHTLISLGDNFDRGGLARGVYKFLTTLPRAICLRGNHELLLEELFARGSFEDYDLHNGTAQTIGSLAYMSKTDAICNPEVSIPLAAKYPGLRQWINSLPYYFETKCHVFTHAWIPYEAYRGVPLNEISEQVWRSALWSNVPDCIGMHKMMLHPQGLSYVFKNGIPDVVTKKIVVGHWSTHNIRLEEDIWYLCMITADPKNRKLWNCSLYDGGGGLGKNFVCLDGTTCISKKVPVYVIEDEPI